MSKLTAYELYRLSKKQRLSDEQFRELLIKEGVIIQKKTALDGLKKSNKIMSKVRAKFKCDSNEQKDGDQHQVKLSAVMGGSEENKSFSRWTPVANLEMWISDETPAANVFEVGKEYYLDFTPAD